MRRALSDLGLPAAQVGPILKLPSGAPKLPEGVSGSISHKDGVAVALASRTGVGFVGVDIEVASCSRRKRPCAALARRVLTDRERAGLGGLVVAAPAVSADSEVLLSFSLKESVYKALHPYLHRHVGFQEAEVSPRADGSCDTQLCLRGGEGPFEVASGWMLLEDGACGAEAVFGAGGMFLTYARIARAAGSR